MNVLKSHLRITVETLLGTGVPQREIERRTGVDRKTIRRYARRVNSPGVATGFARDVTQTPPPWPPASDGSLMSAATNTISACKPHHAWIEVQVTLGRNAVSIFQDLVKRHGFAHQYNSVKRFVATLKAREPDRFDVLEFLPGEEAQINYGQGAPTRTASGKYKRPYLFVMTLKYSDKSFRTTRWKTSQEIWTQLHEEGFRALGGARNTSCWTTSRKACSVPTGTSQR